ncbi:hypothetical protein [Streptosporangium jomthongense]|uniref:Uncharacterized protein n=1 Tax=Streptosporangium jomthongense TaxID=1193683 RepID=A0ABV8F8B3_9ACTN
MIRRLRALWADLTAPGDPGVDYGWSSTLNQLTDPLADLPSEVRQLVHAVDRMRDRWADADLAARRELWQDVHTACDAVWDRKDPRA